MQEAHGAKWILRARTNNMEKLLVIASSKNTNKSRPQRTVAKRKTINQLLPALVAVGSAATLVPAPAEALELGDIQVNSALGHPLQASIAYALNPNEALYDYCVFINKGAVNTGLPAVTRARVSIINNQIILSGAVPIKEPLLSVRVTVDCPYTANLARDYMLMVNPPSALEAKSQVAVAESILPSAANRPTASSTPAATKPSAIRQQAAAPIQSAKRYRVRTGDTLSGIASRLIDRPIGLWPAAEAIFAANPEAFLNGDMNQLRAGSLLTIPFMQNAQADVVSPVTAISDTPAKSAYADNEASSYSGYESASLDSQATQNTLQQSDDLTQIADAPVTTAQFAADAIDDTGVLESGNAGTLRSSDTVISSNVNDIESAKPGDVFVGGTLPEDTAAAAAYAPKDFLSTDASDVDDQPADIGSQTSSWSWLAWLSGSGIALIIGLALFGRRLRDYFGGGAAANVMSDYSRRSSDADITQKSKGLAEIDVQMGDDASVDQSFELDADLGAGTGLKDNADVDLAQDFGFTATHVGDEVGKALDLELPEDNATGTFESLPTDIIAATPIPRETILDSEIPPNADDDGEYDLSMIVDATKQALGDMDATAKDLMAIQVDKGKNADDESSYTLSKEVDYKILEQDYEEELTATQALNHEIARAALELAERMDAEDITAEMPSADETAIIDPTSKLRKSQDPEITAELTAELPTDTLAENEEFISDLDDTGVNEELTAEMITGSDETVEMIVESGTVDTKKAAG